MVRSMCVRAGAVLVAAALSATLACESPPVPILEAGKTRSFETLFSTQRTSSYDLVFVIDNSPSMRAQQPLLQKSLVEAVRRLLRPHCFDFGGGPTGVQAVRCPDGSLPEAGRARDLRVAVLSSSLGGHGTTLCPREVSGMDDRGHLIPSVRPEAPNPTGEGFLWWRDGDDAEVEEFLEAFRGQIEAVGSEGCEFEAPLEAWYRFLVDPTPPERIIVDADGRSDAARDAAGNVLIDHELLRQRERFLRPESMLGIVVVSDENDCSIMDGGALYHGADRAHLALEGGRRMARPSAMCAVNPNDACCFSCDEAGAHPECSASGCEPGATLSEAEDPLELRCFDQMRRFGKQLTYPLQRYVDALVSPRLLDARTGGVFENPLFAGAGRRHGQRRNSYSVQFTTLSGVPWQDLDGNLDPYAPDLDPLGPWDLNLENIWLAPEGNGTQRLVTGWDVILGETGHAKNGPFGCNLVGEDGCGIAPVPPWDPFMIGSVEPRAHRSEHPISWDFIVDPAEHPNTSNDINGHERRAWSPTTGSVENISSAHRADSDVLQPACVFPLEAPIECEPKDPSCLCSDEIEGTGPGRFVCRRSVSEEPSTTQYFAQAFPGQRQLQLVRDSRSYLPLLSLCPKNSIPDAPLPVNHPDFGYNHLFSSIAPYPNEGRGSHLVCDVPAPTKGEQGESSCVVVESRVRWPEREPLFSDEADPFECSEPGRVPLSHDKRALLTKVLMEREVCGTEGRVSCDEVEACEILQLDGAAAYACRTEEKVASLHAQPGFCVVDGPKSEWPHRAVDDSDPLGLGGSAAAATPGDDYAGILRRYCGRDQRAAVRFVGQGTPRPGTISVILCQMADFDDAP